MASVSHGRGGAGNIVPDSQEYADTEIIRKGEEGDHGDGPFSTGRGGAGNIGSPHTKATAKPHEDVIPEATLLDNPKDYHIGRGGAGNERHEHPEGDQPKGEVAHERLTDRLIHKVMGKK